MTITAEVGVPAIPASLTTALDRVADAIAIFTAEESPVAAQIVYVNDAYVRQSGYSSEQLIGHSSVLLAGAKPDLAHVREIARAVRGGSFFTVTQKFRPDGSAYTVEMYLAPLRDRVGGVTHFVLRQRDVGLRVARRFESGVQLAVDANPDTVRSSAG